MTTALLILLLMQDPNTPPDPEKVNRAIDKGTEYLLAAIDVDPGHDMLRCDELILYALAHVGKAGDPRVKKLIARIMKSDLNSGYQPTYSVSLRAMALAQIDSAQYQVPIAQCAWWLVNAQTDNGQWDYWGPKEKPPGIFEKVQWPGKQATGEKSKSDRGLLVKRTAKWTDRGLPSKVFRNTSTAQYAVLGLYAAYRAKVWVPQETWDKTVQSTLRSQGKGGGWGYIDPADTKNDWGMATSRANRSMTASQLSVLAVLKGVLETPPREIDDSMDRGFKWLARDFTLARAGAMKGPNFDGTDLTGVYYYYGTYSVERAGILWGREKIGEHWWYAQGANELLRLQKEDGSWGEDYGSATDRPACAAFAVLFLKRAVPPPVITGGGKKEEPPKK